MKFYHKVQKIIPKKTLLSRFLIFGIIGMLWRILEPKLTPKNVFCPPRGAKLKKSKIGSDSFFPIVFKYFMLKFHKAAMKTE